MITEQDIAIIDKFILKKISKEELEKGIGKRYSYIEFDKLLSRALQENTENHTNQLFRKIFWYLPTNLSKQELDRIYTKYISIRIGHFEHEDMLSHFHLDIIDPEQNVRILENLVTTPPSYFKLDDSEPIFLEKCLFTISKQPTKEAKEALLKFTLSQNETIARASKLYLENIPKNV